MSASRSPLGLAAAAVLALTHAADAAEPREACLAAHTEAQRLRKAGKLRESRARLVTCAAASCPSMVVNDCGAWLGQVESELPTVVVVARDEAGHDVTDAQLLVDGEPVANRLDGAPVPLDPGAHVVRVVAPGAAPVERQIVVATGQKDRALPFVVRAPLAAPSRVPIFVLGGAGVVGIGAFAVLAAMGQADYDHLASTCAPRCNPNEGDGVRAKFTAADVSLGVGLAALAAGGVVLWLQQRGRGTSSAFTLVPRAEGATGVLVRKF